MFFEVILRWKSKSWEKMKKKNEHHFLKCTPWQQWLPKPKNRWNFTNSLSRWLVNFGVLLGTCPPLWNFSKRKYKGKILGGTWFSQVQPKFHVEILLLFSKRWAGTQKHTKINQTPTETIGEVSAIFRFGKLLSRAQKVVLDEDNIYQINKMDCTCMRQKAVTEDRKLSRYRTRV